VWDIEACRPFIQEIPTVKERVGIVKENKDFKKLIRFIKAAWGNDMDGTVYVSVHLCEEGVET
jgi:hypothetical protein